MREGTPLRAGLRNLQSGRGWEQGVEKKAFLPPRIASISSNTHPMMPAS
jgi:hypothetical protein